MEGYTVDKYLSSLKAQELSIRHNNFELKTVFKKTLVSTDNEKPLCMRMRDYLPLIMPTYLVSKRNLRSILKFPFFCDYRWTGLELAGIRTKNDTFYIGKNIICDADGTPLFVPVIKYNYNGHVECLNIYIHSKVVEQNTYISKVLFKQFIPVLAVKTFDLCNFGMPSGVNSIKKANIIINDINKFYKVPKLHSMGSMLNTDFGTMIANELSRNKSLVLE